jgi:hypothetical protein
MYATVSRGLIAELRSLACILLLKPFNQISFFYSYYGLKLMYFVAFSKRRVAVGSVSDTLRSIRNAIFEGRVDRLTQYCARSVPYSWPNTTSTP